ncbi:MAG: E3 ubiquitin ligase family protein [Candidatus Aenigmarchaeota archaeon]|nr:E3 ubiquitin ligase family protein [Candidatus Aenigmarchaeota archaeon]
MVKNQNLRLLAVLLVFGFPFVVLFAIARPIACGIIGVLLGIVLFIIGLKSLFFKRMIENIPTSDIRSIAMGLVEVVGEVVPIKLLKSPFSGEKCVYYMLESWQGKQQESYEGYKIFKKYTEGKLSLMGLLNESKKNFTASEKFYLKDKTDSILIDGRKAVFNLKSSKRVIPIEKGEGYCFEYMIKPGDKVYIMGTASKNPNSGLSKKHTENIIIKKGNNDKIFYISDKSEKEAVSKLKWNIRAYILVGMFLNVWSKNSGGFSHQMNCDP